MKSDSQNGRDSKLWEINREGLRLIGEFVVPSYYDTDCWQGYKAGERKEEERHEEEIR